MLVSGATNNTFDLKPSLPAGVRTGGTFRVDPNGTPLPAGIGLTLDGVLYANGATLGETRGVIFTYTEPL